MIAKANDYGRLVLSRSVKQVVHLDTIDRRITVCVVATNPLKLGIDNAKAVFTTGFHDSRLAWNTIAEIMSHDGLIRVEARNEKAPTSTQLCFTAPRSVKIVRGEIENGSSTTTDA